jgi:hypothetical protein
MIELTERSSARARASSERACSSGTTAEIFVTVRLSDASRYVPCLLLVTGLPGCGKSTLVRYASERRRGQPVILEDLAPDDELRRLWLSGLSKGDAKAFVRALRNHPREAVVEWGFPVNAPCIAFIKSMKDNGVRVVWFECPDDVALARYIERDDRPVEPFDAQVSSIRENYEWIMGEVEPEIIEVLTPDGSGRTAEKLYELVWPK